MGDKKIEKLDDAELRKYLHEKIRSDEERASSFLFEAMQRFALECYGDVLAKEAGIKLYGMESIIFYLVNKHGWQPADIRAMSIEDLEVGLRPEFDEWHGFRDCCRRFMKQARAFGKMPPKKKDAKKHRTKVTKRR